MERRNGQYDIHSLDPNGCEISARATFDFCKKVIDSSKLRERLAIAEKITGKQTAVTAMLYGRNDGATDLPSEKELEMQEKIIAEKKRMVTSE